jgi:hypothetical protein
MVWGARLIADLLDGLDKCISLFDIILRLDVDIECLLIDMSHKCGSVTSVPCDRTCVIVLKAGRDDLQ